MPVCACGGSRMGVEPPVVPTAVRSPRFYLDRRHRTPYIRVLHQLRG